MSGSICCERLPSVGRSLGALTTLAREIPQVQLLYLLWGMCAPRSWGIVNVLLTRSLLLFCLVIKGTKGYFLCHIFYTRFTEQSVYAGHTLRFSSGPIQLP